MDALAEFHHTIIVIIVVVALLTALAKGIALWTRWRDQHDWINRGRRIVAIFGCLLCASINSLRLAGRAEYDPVALAQGATYILILLFVVMWFGISEWRIGR